jgi:hypothetical protein
MDPITKSKIKFVYDGKDEKESKSTSNEWVHLGDYIDADQLECDYGGKFNFTYEIESYWSSLLEKTGNPYKIIDYN